MARILNAHASIEHLEGKDEAKRKTEASIGRWEQKWQVSSQVILGNYSQLVQRTNELEHRRVALVDACRAVCNRGAGAFAAEALDQPYPEMALWISFSNTVYELRNTIEASLSLYRVDTLGLYYRIAYH